MSGDRVRRVWHPAVAGAGEGETLALPSDEAHHVLRVLRLRLGDALTVFDGRGREWDAKLVGIAGAEATVRIEAERTEPVEPALPVTIVQALCRPDRLEWALQKGTEVGAAAFALVTTARVEPAVLRGVRIDRWRRILTEAAKQSGRRRIPSIDGPTPIHEVLPRGALGVLLHPTVRGPRLLDVLAAREPQPTWLAVGPEGGFDEAEVETLVARGWLVAGLGPRTLRTETAGTVACALVLSVWDDLGRSVDGRGSGS